MRLQDYLRLLALAAIWGSSFVFMRITAPVVGPYVTAQSRLFIAGVILTLAFAVFGTKLAWRAHWKSYVTIGALNAAIPFTLFAWAARSIPGSLSAILNSTVPLFAALIAALAGAERLTARRAAGLAIGFAGVVVVSGVDPRTASSESLLAIGACLGASVCYAFSGVFMKRLSGVADVRCVAAGSVLAAGLMLVPTLPFSPAFGTITPAVIGSLAALALLCSALAYAIYYRLIQDVGPTRTMIVTYLIPVFGVLWGRLLLGEALPVGALAGGILVLVGTILVARN